MSETDVRRYLIVANQTLPGTELKAEIPHRLHRRYGLPVTTIISKR
jgi:hypothetical protein